MNNVIIIYIIAVIARLDGRNENSSFHDQLLSRLPGRASREGPQLWDGLEQLVLMCYDDLAKLPHDPVVSQAVTRPFTVLDGASTNSKHHTNGILLTILLPRSCNSIVCCQYILNASVLASESDSDQHLKGLTCSRLT